MKSIIKGAFGCLIISLLIFVLLCAVGIWAINSYTGSIAETVVEDKTGFPTDMGTVDLSVLGGKLHIQSAKIQNPPGFPDPRFVDLKEFKVQMKPASLIGERIEFDEVIVDLTEVAMIVDEEKQINAMKFLEGFQTEEQKESEEPPAFFIKTLRIKLDKVTVLNPQFRIHSPRTFDINLDMELTDVDDVEEIVAPLIKELRAKGMDQIAGLVLDSLLSVETYREALKDAKSLSKDILERGGSILDKGGESIQQGAEEVKGLFDSLRNKN